MNHYTYLITINSNTEKQLFYIGVRSCNDEPEQDINYLGSSRLLNHLIIHGLEVKKEIISVFNSRTEAFEYEQQIISEFISNLACINLTCKGHPYNSSIAKSKMEFIRELYPDIIPNTPWAKIYRELNAKDMVYCVGNYSLTNNSDSAILKFINHPDRLQYYYSKTFTKTFWPGRDDKLMIIKKGKKTFYQTELSVIDGTPEEQIEELLNNHLLPGQRTHILETVVETFKLIKKNKEMYDLIDSYLVNEYSWLKSRLKRIHK